MKITIDSNKIFISGTLGNYCFSTTKDGNICVKRRPKPRTRPLSAAELADKFDLTEESIRKIVVHRENWQSK